MHTQDSRHDLIAPEFVQRDPARITREMVASYEAMVGRTLYPAQLERMLIDLMAYRESLVREAIQDAALLNLVRFSRAPVLDYLGENIGVKHLAARPAQTLLRFALDPATATATVLPAQTLVQGANLAFATVQDVHVPVGAREVDALATCTTAGAAGNGLLPGQVAALATPMQDLAQRGLWVQAVGNVSTTMGGADAEQDEQLRQRIMLAPEQFSNAGSAGAYRFHARSSHPDVVDVAVVSPSPGVVRLLPLTRTGLPSQAVMDAVMAACNAERVRPLTDLVEVAEPEALDFTVTARLTLLRGADADAALRQARAAAQAYCDAVQSALGRDVVRDALIAAMKGYGVYAVGLQMDADVVVAPHQWARCTGVDVSVAGFAQG